MGKNSQHYYVEIVRLLEVSMPLIIMVFLNLGVHGSAK
jgi:hypothetical protein